MSKLSKDPGLISRVTEAIKEFDFWDYGLNEVDPHSEYAEWVPDLANKIVDSITTPAAPEEES